MSAILTWHKGGLGTKTNTTPAAWIDDIEALVVSKAGDADFKWEVADSENTTSPLFIVLKRKDASAGRILIMCFTSSAAGVNPAIFDVTPQTNTGFIAYFPAGNVDTPSGSLDSGSGTIMGVDTNCTKVASIYFLSSSYGANYQPFYFDCEDGLLFGFQNPAGAQCYFMGAGALVVDAADVAYPCAIGGGSNSAATFGSTSPPIIWTAAVSNAGAFSVSNVQARYPTVSKPFFMAYSTCGGWGAQNGANDMTLDAANSKVNFAPIPLLSQTKGEGIKLKFRQIGWGPGTSTPFTQYDGTGPVPKAWQFNAATAGGDGPPYVVNYKI